MKEDMKQYLDSLTKLPKVTKDIIDLHNHTTTSDGTLSPQQLIDFALQRGLKIIAITDHDTIDCLDWSLEYSKNKPIEIVPGIEFSCEEIARGFDEVHILGLFIDPKNERLIERTKIIRKKRVERAREIIKKLQLLDYSINFEEVEQGVGASLGRPHIAKVLVEKYPEKFTNVSDIFSTLLGTGKPAFVPRGDKIKIEEAVSIIKEAGGISSLAHPGVFNNEDVKELVKLFVDAGGQAIETNYPYDINIKNITTERSYQKNQLSKKLAEENNLLETGGSDFHGSIRKSFVGDCGVSSDNFQKLKRKLQGAIKNGQN